MTTTTAERARTRPASCSSGECCGGPVCSRLSWAAEQATYTLFVSIAMGAAGAVLSVMTRMAGRDGFNLEFEVVRKSMHYLGGLRPWIGALFAFVVYLALKSNLVEIFQTATHGLYFYATIAFLAGFSERRAKVLLDSVGGGASSGPDGADDDKKKR